MRRLPALLILFTALQAAPLQGQTAGETSVGISMNFGPRLGATLSLKRFVKDEVAAQCGFTVGPGLHALGCGAQRYGLMGDRTYAGIDIGVTTLSAFTTRREGEPAAKRPPRFVFAAASIGLQARPSAVEEVRPYIGLGPAVAIGPGSEVGSFLQGMPRIGPAQTMFTLDLGLELYPVSH
jgi:hypothetical protein